MRAQTPQHFSRDALPGGFGFGGKGGEGWDGGGGGGGGVHGGKLEKHITSHHNNKQKKNKQKQVGSIT